MERPRSNHESHIRFLNGEMETIVKKFPIKMWALWGAADAGLFGALINFGASGRLNETAVITGLLTISLGTKINSLLPVCDQLLSLKKQRDSLVKKLKSK